MFSSYQMWCTNLILHRDTGKSFAALFTIFLSHISSFYTPRFLVMATSEAASLVLQEVACNNLSTKGIWGY